MKLCNDNLLQIKNASIPDYDRSKLKAGIVHIGLGNFHRAHQAWYLHRLMMLGLAYDWAIIGAGVRPNDEDMRKKLESQDFLTTLIELSPEGRSVEIIGSMIGFVPIEEGHGALIRQIAEPSIKIVSLTVTEGGYYIDPASKGFDQNHPDIVHDAENPNEPKTAFGAIIAAIKLRREKGIGPITCQSCDNLQGNGKILRQTIVSLAALSDTDLASWIDQNCSFPNAMVDCIVPATGAKELALTLELGIEDQAPVTHENFRQWVIEDDFCAGRPAWEKAGVTLSEQVHDYEKMKIRILNGGHQVIAAAGDLLSIESISEAARHPLISALLHKVECQEIVPHVGDVPEYKATDYLKLIERRFLNPKIVDTTRRVAFDGSSRQPGFILPSVRECLTKGIEPRGLALVSAIWAHYVAGVRVDGSKIETNDPYWQDLQIRALMAKTNAIHWLENKPIYGDLANEPKFTGNFINWFNLINDQGLENCLKAYLDS